MESIFRAEAAAKLVSHTCPISPLVTTRNPRTGTACPQGLALDMVGEAHGERRLSGHFQTLTSATCNTLSREGAI